MRALDSRLNAMHRDGALTRAGRERFTIAGDRGELVGSVSAHRDGYGWFTPEEGGTPDVHLDQAQMTGVMHGDRLRIRITADDGRGRRSGAVLEVLGRGTRLDEQVAGHGLGLGIVRDIVEAWGGRLSLEDSPLGGLRVAVSLPGRR